MNEWIICDFKEISKYTRGTTSVELITNIIYSDIIKDQMLPSHQFFKKNSTCIRIVNKMYLFKTTYEIQTGKTLEDMIDAYNNFNHLYAEKYLTAKIATTKEVLTHLL